MNVATAIPLIEAIPQPAPAPRDVDRPAGKSAPKRDVARKEARKVDDGDPPEEKKEQVASDGATERFTDLLAGLLNAAPESTPDPLTPTPEGSAPAGVDRANAVAVTTNPVDAAAAVKPPVGAPKTDAPLAVPDPAALNLPASPSTPEAAPTNAPQRSSVVTADVPASDTPDAPSSATDPKAAAADEAAKFPPAPQPPVNAAARAQTTNTPQDGSASGDRPEEPRLERDDKGARSTESSPAFADETSEGHTRIEARGTPQPVPQADQNTPAVTESNAAPASAEKPEAHKAVEKVESVRDAHPTATPSMEAVIPIDATGPAAATAGAAGVPAASNGSSIPVAAEHVSRQVVQAILAHDTDISAQGQRSFEMMLDPPELGRLLIQMNRGSKGLEVRISAEDDRIGALLQTSGGDLQQALQASSLSLGQFSTTTQSGADQSREFAGDERTSRTVQSRVPAFVSGSTTSGRSSGVLNVMV